MDAPTLILKQSLTSATPLLIAGFGELLAQRAGLINISIEGTMLMGAIAAFAAAVITGHALAAIPAALIIGLLFAAIFALATVWSRADQIVVGTQALLADARDVPVPWWPPCQTVFFVVRCKC